MVCKGSRRARCGHTPRQIPPFWIVQAEIELHAVSSARYAAPVNGSGDAADEIDRQNPQDGTAVNRVGARLVLLPIRTSIAVRIAGAVSRPVAEEGHFPIVVQAILIRVGSAQAQHIEIARVVEVSR